MAINANCWSEENLPQSGNSGEQISFCLRQTHSELGHHVRASLNFWLSLTVVAVSFLSPSLSHSLGLSVPELKPLYYAALLPVSL